MGDIDCITSTPTTPVDDEFPPPSDGKIVWRFDCAICGESLKRYGPPLQFFTFGKILRQPNLSRTVRELLAIEFAGDPCFKNETYDCKKIMMTKCGHIFHSGCIREWYFIRRHDRLKKCPYCNQRSAYHDCIVLHPTVSDPKDNDESDDDNTVLRPLSPELDYSDISGASSSYSDESDTEVDHMATVEEAPQENPNNNATGPESDEEDFLYRIRLVQHDLDLTTSQLEEYFGSGDSTNPFHFRQFGNRFQLRLRQVLRQCLTFADDYNWIHVWTLVWLCLSVCGSYTKQMEEYVDNIHQIDDDKLDDALPVPMGYEFLRQMLTTSVIVSAYETFIRFCRKLI